jgi:hypothetical protein
MCRESWKEAQKDLILRIKQDYDECLNAEVIIENYLRELEN